MVCGWHAGLYDILPIGEHNERALVGGRSDFNAPSGIGIAFRQEGVSCVNLKNE